MTDRRGGTDRRQVPRGERRRGRPPIAASVSQLPAVTLPTHLHDAAIHEASRRGVPVAQVVREALFFHLKNRQAPYAFVV